MKINFDELDESSTYSSPFIKNLDSLQTQTQYDDHQIYNNGNILVLEENDIDESISSFVRKQIQRQNINNHSQIQDPSQKQTLTQLNHKQLQQFWPKQQTNQQQQIWDHKIDSKLESKKNILKHQYSDRLQHRTKANKQIQKNKKMNWVYSYKKHKCGNAQVPTKVLKQASQLAQTTHKPFLYPNRYSKQANKCLIKTYSVYDRLYRQNDKRKMKTQIRKMHQLQRNKETRPQINQKYFQKKNKRYVPLQHRLSDILTKKVKAKQLRQQIDETSGIKMFQPNLTMSQQSYRIFTQSLSKQKQRPHLTSKCDSIQSIYTYKPKINNIKQVNKIDKNVIDYLTGIFYDNENQDQITVIQRLKKQQFDIIQPFLYQVEQIQVSQTQSSMNKTTKSIATTSKGTSRLTNAANSNSLRVMNRQQFLKMLSRYYQNLNLHDKQILRKIIKNEKNKNENKNNQKVSNSKPIINIRSSSLDSISQRYSQQLYYI